MNLDFGHWLMGRLSGVERIIGAAGPVLFLLAYFVLALVIDLTMFDSLWAVSGWRGYVASFALVALPLGCLAAAAGLVGASEYSGQGVRSAYLRLARRILGWIAVAGLVLSALVPVYIAHTYVARWINLAMEKVLCRFEWLPGSCRDGGTIVVLLTAAVVSFFVGKLSARRRAPSLAREVRDDSEVDPNTSAGGGPPSSAGSGALPVPAE